MRRRGEERQQHPSAPPRGVHRGRAGAAPTVAKRLFLSHHWRDRHIAELIKQCIERTTANQIEVWYSSDQAATGGMEPGEDWESRVRSRIENSRAIIALLTPRSVRKPWLFFESGFAAADPTRQVMPVCFGLNRPSDIPSPLKKYHPNFLVGPKSLRVFIKKLLHTYQIDFDEQLMKPVLRNTAIGLSAALMEMSKTKRQRFQEFFGDAALHQNIRLVFAYRELGGLPEWKTHHPIPKVRGRRPEPEGVREWLPTQDVRAAVELTNMFARYTRQKVSFIHDIDVRDDGLTYCAVALGLGFNGFTHRLARWCEDGLFKIEWGRSHKKEFSIPTDHISIGGRLRTKPAKGEDHAIVARIVNDGRVCFVCAGRTAPGTAVAGYFLAQKWDVLWRKYEDQNKDLRSTSLVALLRHQSDQGGTMELTTTGVIEELHWWP